jgi:hypothetical protein
MSTKRSKVTTVATAGTLTLAAAISAAAVTLSSSSSPLPASADAAYLTTIGQPDASQQTTIPDLLGELRALRTGRYEQQLAAAKAAAKAAGKAAARKAAAAQAAAAKASAAQAAAQAAQPSAAAQATPAAQPTQQAQPAQAAAVTTPSGSPEQVAEQMLGQFGWSASQFSCLQPLWQQESGWNVAAENPSSGAYGIPQALPGSEMASAGADWQTDAATQIRWGLSYIQGRYGSPCGAWNHEVADGWY